MESIWTFFILATHLIHAAASFIVARTKTDDIDHPALVVRNNSPSGKSQFYSRLAMRGVPARPCHYCSGTKLEPSSEIC
jgi:hypothetical protein